MFFSTPLSFTRLSSSDEKVKAVDFLPLGFGFLGTKCGVRKVGLKFGRTKEKKQLSSSSSLLFKATKHFLLKVITCFLDNKVINYVEIIKSIIVNALNRVLVNGDWYMA